MRRWHLETLGLLCTIWQRVLQLDISIKQEHPHKHQHPVHHINRQPWHSFIPGHVNIQFALSQDPWPKDPKPAAAKAAQSTRDPGRTGQEYQDQEYQNKDYQGEDYLDQDYQATDDYLEDESEEKREEQELAIDIRSSNKKKQSRRNGYGK